MDNQTNSSKQADYIGHLIEVANEVRLKVAKCEDVKPHEIIESFVDPAKNNTVLEQAFIDAGLMTKAEFKSALQRKAHNDHIKAALGFLPKTVGDYVTKCADKHSIKVLVNGSMQRKWVVEIAGEIVTDEARKQDRKVDTHYRIQASRSFNTEDFKRELRTTRDELGIRSYTDSQISDAVDNWFRKSKDDRRADLFGDIAYLPGRATGPEGKAMWEKMERAAFDTSDTSQGFAIAVIKKFMWQVKRKGMGLPVTNHLMPVLTGRQGGGKSTLVGNMLQPIFDGVKQTTFADISDNRLIDLWETPVLFMDEMSGAKKADMNIVKQSITASVLTRRPMRSNTDVQVQQCATFIGCSNEGLGEIIRDSSGIRRFAELDFAPCPDWEAMKEIDWLMLWHSVDEYGDDPSLHVMDALKEQQEDNRNMCSVEMWAREHAHEFKDWRKAGVLHEHFQDWENEKFPTYKTNVSIFGKRINTLIKQRPDFKWEAKKKSGYAWFRYVG